MSLAFGLGFPHWQSLSGGFTPASLFAAGEQGAWYDPSDFSTLFQDSAGTTPVTAVEQPVGLMLDKSKNAIGTNGAKRVNLLDYTEQFDNAYWTKSLVTVTADSSLAPNGTLTADTITANGTLGQHHISRASIVPNATSVLITVYAKANTANFIHLLITGANTYAQFDLNTGALVFSSAGTGVLTSATSNAVGNGWFRFSVVCTQSSGSATNLRIYPLDASNNVAGPSETSTASIEAWGADLRLASEASTLPTYQRITDTWYNTFAGNHAFQTTPTSRPTLSSRVNLLTKTEDFSDAVWVKDGAGTAVTANQAVAPNGTLTADLLTFTAGSGKRVRQDLAVTSGQTVTFSVYARSVTGTASFALAVAGPSNTNPNLFATLTETWQVFSVTTTFTASGTSQFRLWSNDLDSQYYAWGADLRVANDGVGLPVYQRVDTATSYDTAGFPLYLRFDGSDDSFLTNSVNFETFTSDGQARRNLLTFPTAFDDAIWVKTNSTVTANTEIAPNGTVTADTFRANAVTGAVQIAQTVTLPTTAMTFSVYIKAGTHNFIQLLNNGDAEAFATFNVLTGAIGTTGSKTTASVQVIGNGWYRCIVTFSAATTYNTAFRTYIAPSINAIYGQGITAAGTETVFLWGAQLEVGSTATAFQNIGTDKMTVWAGVRKLSDAASGVVAELSAASFDNNGTFTLNAPSVGADYFWRSKGTLNSSASTAASYPSPITAVLTGIGDISGDISRLRYNATQILNLTADQGTGNYGNYPLYIGRRNNATVPFNGRLYSLLIRGAQSTATQIAQTENYVEQKTFGKDMSNVYSDPVLTAASEEITMPDGEEIFMSVTYQ